MYTNELRKQAVNEAVKMLGNKYLVCMYCGKNCNVSDMNGTVCLECYIEIMEAQI